MSTYKTHRLPKKDYENSIAMRKSDRPCHKKKNGLPRPNLVCSRDREGNIFCANCKMLLIPKNVSNEEFEILLNKFEKMGGVSNCCYDCEFDWYCNKCCFTYISEIYTPTIFGITVKQYVFRSCSKTMMMQLSKTNHGGGRYSGLKNDHVEYLRKFFANELKHGHPKSALTGRVVNMQKIIETYNHPDHKKNIKIYKDNTKMFHKKMLRLNMNLSDELLNNEEYVKQFHYVENPGILGI